MCTSVPQMPVFMMRMRTSSRPHGGTFTSASVIPGAARGFTSAGIILVIGKSNEALNADLLVFDPSIVLVGLQPQRRLILEIQLVILDDVLAVDPHDA